jgi:hypothetical protein
MDEFLNALLLQYVVAQRFTHTPHHEIELDCTECLHAEQIGRNCAEKIMNKTVENYFKLITYKFVFVSEDRWFDPRRCN